MMWSGTATRRELVELLHGDGERVWSESRELGDWDFTRLRELEVNRDRLILVWRERPGNSDLLPSIIVVGDDKRRDFLAWALTYLPDFRPFTSLVRVMPQGFLSQVRRERFPSLGKWRTACLGLVVGEAMSYGALGGEARALTAVAAASTYSFAISRGVAAGYERLDLQEIGRGWERARVITKQAPLPLSLSDLQLPWEVLLALLRDSSGPEERLPGLTDSAQTIGRCCKRIAAGRELSKEDLDKLVNGALGREMFRGWSRGTWEEQVSFVEQLRPLLVAQSGEQQVSFAFLAAYVVSCISPGTIEHSQLLRPYLANLPTAFLWYCFLAGLVGRSKLESLENGFGRRIVRDILLGDPPLERPRCDISLPELEILMTSDFGQANLRVGVRGHLDVEILSGISTLVRWPPKQELTLDLFGERAGTQDARRVMVEFNDAMIRADALRAQLSRLLSVPDEPVRKATRRRKR